MSLFPESKLSLPEVMNFVWVLIQNLEKSDFLRSSRALERTVLPSVNFSKEETSISFKIVWESKDQESFIFTNRAFNSEISNKIEIRRRAKSYTLNLCFEKICEEWVILFSSNFPQISFNKGRILYKDSYYASNTFENIFSKHLSLDGFDKSYLLPFNFCKVAFLIEEMPLLLQTLQMIDTSVSYKARTINHYCNIESPFVLEIFKTKMGSSHKDSRKSILLPRSRKYGFTDMRNIEFKTYESLEILIQDAIEYLG